MRLRKGDDWLTLADMSNGLIPTPGLPLEVLPAYTGMNSLEDILQAPRGKRLLWLEIRLNDQFDIQSWQEDPEVQDSYRKACRLFTTCRSLVQSVLPLASLPLDT